MEDVHFFFPPFFSFFLFFRVAWLWRSFMDTFFPFFFQGWMDFSLLFTSDETDTGGLFFGEGCTVP